MTSLDAPPSRQSHPSAAPVRRADDRVADHAAYRATTRFASLDGLRCLCIALVLWHHAPVRHALEAPPLWAGRGFLGVDFFFVLSGFLITTLLLRERRAQGRVSLRGFYWRRALRILPVYLLVVTAVCAYYVGIKGETRLLELVPFYYLFAANVLTEHVPTLEITWSLAVEEQYYLLWPLLLVWLPPRTLLPVLAALVALNVAAVTGALRPLGVAPVDLPPLRLEMFPATYAPILLGSALAVILDDARGFRLAAALLGHRAAPVAALAVLAALVAVLPRDLVGWPNLALHLAMTAVLASIVLREDHVLRPVLAARPLARLGEVSYGLYLYHLIALHVAGLALVRAGVADPWAVTAVYAVLSVAMAEASFRLYERPFLSLRHRPWKRAPRTA